MEKCNCDLCQRREFFSKFDKHGQYTGKTETLSIYEQVARLRTNLENAGNVDPSLLGELEEIATRIDKFDNALIRFGAKDLEIYEKVKKLREELY